MAERTQRNNIMLAFITLVAVVLIVSIIGFITFRKARTYPENFRRRGRCSESR